MTIMKGEKNVKINLPFLKMFSYICKVVFQRNFIINCQNQKSCNTKQYIRKLKH